MFRRYSSKLMLGVINSGYKLKPFLSQFRQPWTNVVPATPNIGEISILRNLSSKAKGVLSKGHNKPLLSKSYNPWKLIMPNIGQKRNYEPLSDWKDLTGYEYVNMLNDKTIDSFLRGHESVLVMFYAPWCHHCKGAKPEFAKAAYALDTEMKSAKLAAVDCIVYPVIYEKYEVTGYPTFKYYRNGTLIGEYHHRRRAMDFVHFMLRTPKTKGDM